MEYLKAIYDRYHKAAKTARSRILDEFCKVCGYNRKYAIRLLGAPPPDDETPPVRKRRRSFHYSDQSMRVLETIWKASGHLCSERLKEALPDWLPKARERLKIAPAIEKELLAISSRQIENRLRGKKRDIKKRIYGATRPGALLKSMIPIRTSNWDVRLPGYLEMDTVAHCGNSLSGNFVWTLDATDIQTGWTERVAVMGKGCAGILDGVFDIKNALPFRLRGIDSDNGEEFINYALLGFCLKSRPRIEFTRGRENKKNDNPHVEQKNWTHVRQIFGWDRHECQAALEAMNDLYGNELRLFQNLFQPSFKLKAKTRVGSKVVRKYDKPKTPLRRVLESGKYHRPKMKKLKELAKSLDPFELSETIDRKLERIYRMASQRVGGQNSVLADGKQASEPPRSDDSTSSDTATSSRSRSPWRYWQFSKKVIRRRLMMRKIEQEARSKAAATARRQRMPNSLTATATAFQSNHPTAPANGADKRQRPWLHS